MTLSRFSPEAFADLKDFKKLAAAVSHHIGEQCAAVRWNESYATAGRFDVVDIVESRDPTQLTRAALLVRAYGHSTTETLVTTPWKEFLEPLS